MLLDLSFGSKVRNSSTVSLTRPWNPPIHLMRVSQNPLVVADTDRTGRKHHHGFNVYRGRIQSETLLVRITVALASPLPDVPKHIEPRADAEILRLEVLEEVVDVDGDGRRLFILGSS